MADSWTRRERYFNLSAPGADTAAFTAISPIFDQSEFRFTIALTTSSVVNVTGYNGTTTHKWGLNSSSALNAADLYTFIVPVFKTDQSDNAMVYSVEVETDGVIEFLCVDERRY